MADSGIQAADSETVGAMKTIEKVLIGALLPFRSRMPNGLVVFALARVMRVFLRMSPRPVQRGMLDAVVPYLEGKTKPRQSSMLWLPGDPS